MTTVSATEIKNRLGQFLRAAASEPVVIEKTGKPVAVLLSYQEYQRLERYEDAYWAAQAAAAAQEPPVGAEEAAKLIRRYFELDDRAEA
jgi:antitoxin Phd